MDPPEDVFFKVSPQGLRVTTTAGEWKPDDGLVRVSADESDEFFISIKPI
jgi:hypothetical protein